MSLQLKIFVVCFALVTAQQLVQCQLQLNNEINNAETTELAGSTKAQIPSSCLEAYDSRIGDGEYIISLPNSGLEPFSVYCWKDPADIVPWTVIQRRVDNTTGFYRGWLEYKRGFGDLSKNFFLGLDKIHALTNFQEPQELWVEVKDNVTAYEKYNHFVIGDEYEQYKIKELGTFTGTAGDSLTERHLGMKFTTFDYKTDLDPVSCAVRYEGGWWYKMSQCHFSHLNGNYGSSEFGKGINWYTFRGHTVSMNYAHMAIRAAKK